MMKSFVALLKVQKLKLPWFGLRAFSPGLVTFTAQGLPCLNTHCIS